MTKPVDAGIDTVVDADPAEVNTRACPPEALLSATIRPTPDDPSVSASNSTDVVDEVTLAVALLVDLLVAVGGKDTAANLSRRVEISPTAAKASAGAGGVVPEPPSDSNAIALATGDAVMTDVDAGLDSLAGVVD